MNKKKGSIKILFDPEIFFNGRCGMVRYYAELAAGLRLKGFDVDLPLMVSKSDLISGKKQMLEKLESLPLGKRLRRKIDNYSKKKYWKKVKEGNYDLLLITSPVFEDTFLKILPKDKKYLMVVHDTMRCVLGPDGLFDPAGNNADKLAYLAKSASTVVCISKTVQSDLKNFCMIEPDRPVVIHTGNLLDINIETAPYSALPTRYLLFVGERSGRKNFRFFIHSVAELLKQRDELFLVCTGSCTIWEKDILDTLKINEKVIFIEANDSLLNYLYKNALLLIYPSLYEGFGLPVVEAMSIGCPVVTSDYGALKEIGGESVQYIDPNNKESIVDGVKKIVDDDIYRQVLIEKGLKQSAYFSKEIMFGSFEREIERLCGDGFIKTNPAAELSSKEPVFFSLIVATAGRVKELARFLNSVENVKNKNFEVIIVDQNDDDRLKQIIAEFAVKIQLKHIKMNEKNASKARNIGALEATGNWLSFPDDDCWYTPNTLLKAENEIEKAPFDILLGKIFDANYKPWHCTKTTRLHINSPIQLQSTIMEPTLFIKKADFISLNGFDERFGPGTEMGAGEGLEFGFRAMKQRKKFLFSPSVKILHPNESNINSEIIKRSYRYAFSNGSAMIKYYPGLMYYDIMKNLILLLPRLLFKPVEKRRFYLNIVNGLFDAVIARKHNKNG